jgi:lipoprotein-anchoring transpeptidase ErfK/SrfK
MTISDMHPIVSRACGPVVVLVLVCAAFSVLLPAASAAPARRAGSTAASTRQKIAYPATVTMTTAKISHWAPVVSDVAARKDPSGHAPIVVRVTTVTGDGTQNLMLILKQFNASPSQTWYDVRLAILPNDSTGWVPASALGTVYAVNTHLYIDQQTLTATLKRNGVTIFTTRVGVGEPYWPTPGGQFYVRDKLTDFNNPFYGPIAFGTSARSAVLTEWPGGGFVGVHGTNEPGIIPGRISHGCVRMVNSAIVKLSKLMPVGTPVTVSAPS